MAGIEGGSKHDPTDEELTRDIERVFGPDITPPPHVVRAAKGVSTVPASREAQIAASLATTDAEETALSASATDAARRGKANATEMRPGEAVRPRRRVRRRK